MSRSKFGKEKQNFSIRKYSIGAASVLIGTSLVFGLQEVKADEQFGETLANSLSPIQVEENSQVDETNSLPKQIADETKELVIQENKVESEQVSEVLTRQSGEKYTSKSLSSSEKVSPEQALTPANQEVPIAISSFQEDQKNLVTDVKKLESDLAPEGKYTYEKETAVRNQPTQSAPIVFYAQPGDKVNYDKKLKSDGHQWISYVSYNGTRRYVDLGKVTSSAPSAQSQLTTNKPNQATQPEVIASKGTYTFT
ncbi:TPA: SH3 domain-containing protein, partial [Streptococcus suis]|nr:SH3 domain-containing protein [Streptococcus suis]